MERVRGPSKEFFMLRRWLHLGLCLCVASLTGCGRDNRDGIIVDTNNLISNAGTSVETIKTKVEDFVKKKEADSKDEEAAKKDLDEAVAAAKSLKEIAQKMQSLSGQANAQTPPTPEEKKALLDKHLSGINNAYNQLKLAHREMKRTIDEANKKFEEPMRPLMQALADAEGDFAAIARRK
jgi:phage shock protein A